MEQRLEQTEKDLADYQFNYPTIKELEKENNRLEGCLLAEQEHTQMLEKENDRLAKHILELQKEKGELVDKVTELKKINRKLYKAKVKDYCELEQETDKLLDVINEQDVKIADLEKQIEVAKDLIHQFLIQNPISDWLPKKAGQFLKKHTFP